MVADLSSPGSATRSCAYHPFVKTLESVPQLPEAASAALPARRPVVFVYGLAWAAVVAEIVVQSLTGTWDVDSRDLPAQRWALDLAGTLLPWLLSLGVMRHLDLRPVRWFFFSLFVPLFPLVLAFLVTRRLLSLPYRDWTVEYWNVPFVRRLPGRREYLLTARAPLWHNPRAHTWEAVSDPVLRGLWVLLMAATTVVYIWRASVPTWAAEATVVGVLVTAVVPALVDMIVNSRRRRAPRRSG